MSAITQEAIEQIEQQVPQTDRDRMKSDLWITGSFDAYRKCRNPLASPVFNFGKIKNPVMKEEVKDFYADVLLSGKRNFNTFLNGLYRISPLIEYLNTLSPAGSLLQYPLEKVYSEYNSYLQKNGYTTQDIILSLHKNQEFFPYVEDSSNLLEISALYRFLVDRKYASVPILEKDWWDVAELPFKVELQLSRKRSIIDFRSIRQEEIRKVVKRYIYERLKVRKISTVLDDLKTVRLFSKYLQNEHSEITSLSQITRGIICEYFDYIDSRHFASTTERARKGQLRTFSELSYYLGIGDVPRAKLIFREDYRKPVKHLVKYIPDNVLDQLNAHLDDLPENIRTITLLLEYVGMRVNEACRLKKDCLKYDSENDPFIEYYQYKINRTNRVPISGKIERELKDAISRASDPVYLFTYKGHPQSQESVSWNLNMLAVKYHITDGSGSIWRFQCHQFRHTVAMRYAMMGMSPNMIRMMLGHKTLRSIMPYVNLSDDLASGKLQLFYDHEEEEAKQFLQGEDPESSSEGVLLPNGYCRDNELCQAALACYSCSMFTEDRDILENYLKAVTRRLNYLELQGYVRQAQVYKRIQDAVAQKLGETV